MILCSKSSQIEREKPLLGQRGCANAIPAKSTNLSMNSALGNQFSIERLPVRFIGLRSHFPHYTQWYCPSHSAPLSFGLPSAFVASSRGDVCDLVYGN